MDSDFQKQGTLLFDIKILSPEILSEYKDTLVLIASTKYFNEIFNYLNQIGVANILKLNNTISLCGGSVLQELMTRTIDLGKLLNEINTIYLKELTFLIGGSGILDYALIRAIVQKYNLKNYLEIGTYIGESINNVSDLCSTCHSVTLPPDCNDDMYQFCNALNLPNFSGKLANADNIVHHYCDSKTFDFKKLSETIDIYFIDGDHSYNGVYWDTKNIFECRKEDSFVIWHDFKYLLSYNDEVIRAVKDVLNDDFKNVFITTNNICGIYIPPKYQKDFCIIDNDSYKNSTDLYTYDTDIKVSVKK